MKYVPLIALLFILLACSSVLAQGSYPVYGVHFCGPDVESVMGGKQGWSLEMLFTNRYSEPEKEWNYIKSIRDRGFRIILRLDYDYGYTVPWSDDGKNTPEMRRRFAHQCGKIARDLGDLVDVFVIGNEINPNSPQPSREWYTQLFNSGDTDCVYDQIKAACPHAKVCIFAPGGWPGKENLEYWEYVVDHVDKDADGKPQIDGFCFHAYSGGSTVYDRTCEDPRFGSKLDFKGFTKYLKMVYEKFGTSREVYITESNTFWYFGKWAEVNLQSEDSYRAGWMREAFQTVDQWNQSNDLKINCLCWYVYHYQVKEGGDQWNNSLRRTDNSRLNQAREDFAWTTKNTNYTPGLPGSNLRFEAENFSNSDEEGGRGLTNGTSGIDYFDTTPGNSGGHYRIECDDKGKQLNNVDIGKLPDGTGYYVGWTQPGEWLRYESMSGGHRYRVRVHYSHEGIGDGKVHFTVDGRRVADVNLPATGSAGRYVTRTGLASFYMPQGVHDVRLCFDTSGVNVDWFEFVRATLVE